MRKLTIALLIAVVLAVAVYYFFFYAPPPPRGPLPELVTLAPAETEWILYLDLDTWRSSSAIGYLQKLLPQATADREYREFVAATGFEYSRDLDRAVLALLPGAPATSSGAASQQAIVFAEGRFDRARITQHALRSGTRETHEGTEVIVVNESASGNRGAGPNGRTLFSFLSGRRVAIAEVPRDDGQMLVRGRAVILAAARPRTQTQAQAPLSPLAERAARIAGAPFFAVGRADFLQQLPRSATGGFSIEDQFQELLANVKWLTIAARPEQDQIRLSVHGECESTWQATQLGFLLDGLLVLARSAAGGAEARDQMSREQAQLVERLLKTARIEREKNIVEVRLEIPVALLADLDTARQP